jgi:predicted small secreted protein
MRKLAPALIILSFLALAGCNTVAGVGEDVAGGARTVQGWFGG